MHFFYSFLDKSIGEYNKNNNDDNNRVLMINAIALASAYRELQGSTIKPQIFPIMNQLWQKSYALRLQKIPSLRLDIELNSIVNACQDTVFRSLSDLSKFQRVTMESEISDRKMTWDTYAVEVD